MDIQLTEIGKWSKIPDDLLDSSSIVYSFGAGEDICFEFYLSHKYDSSVYIFDPTPRAVDHFHYCKKVISGEAESIPNPRFGGGDPRYLDIIKSLKPNKVFYKDYGLYNNDQIIKFHFPKNKEHVSLSIDNLQNTSDIIDLQVKKIDTIMNELEHQEIDLLKLNIEGAEILSLQHMMNNTKIRPKCISVQMELYRDKPTAENKKLQDSVINDLLKEYTIYFQNWYNYTFLRK
jgi:FkbM family methyltransferase